MEHWIITAVIAGLAFVVLGLLLWPCVCDATLYAITGTSTASGYLRDIRKAGPLCLVDSVGSVANSQIYNYVWTSYSTNKCRYEEWAVRFNTTGVTGAVSACTLVVATHAKSATTRNTNAELKFLAGTLNNPLAIADTTDFGVTVEPDTTISYAAWAGAGDSTKIPCRLSWPNLGGNTDVIIRASSLKDVCAATGAGDYLRFYNTEAAEFSPVLYITIADDLPSSGPTHCVSSHSAIQKQVNNASPKRLHIGIRGRGLFKFQNTS